MKFLCLPADLEAVGSYRVIYPYGMLELNTSHDVQIEHIGPLQDRNGKTLLSIPEAALGRTHGPFADKFLEADTYIMQRPLELIAAPLAAWLKSHNKTVVVDIDDWMHGIPQTNQGKAALEKSGRHTLETLDRVLKYTDILTVTTPKLAEIYGRNVPQVHILPNYLLARDWKGIEPSYKQDRGPIRVGWMGWKQYRGTDLKVLKRFLPAWLRKHPEVIFVNVGKQDALDYLRLQRGRKVQSLAGEMFPGHAPLTANIDIGLVPLTHNTFNECKSSLKAQEYGACGIPFIAGNTQPQREWCDGTNGIIANEPKEWVEALDAMLHNDLWRKMGEANHRKSWTNMIDTEWKQWEALYPHATKEAA